MMAGVGGDGSTSTREMDAENVGLETIGADCAEGIPVVVVVVVVDVYVCSVDDTATAASTTSVTIDRLRLARNRQLLDTQDIDVVFKPRKRTDRVLKK